jgi:hypothetical protein
MKMIGSNITGGQREPTRPGENELVALNATLERLFEFADIKDSDAPEVGPITHCVPDLLREPAARIVDGHRAARRGIHVIEFRRRVGHSKGAISTEHTSGCRSRDPDEEPVYRKRYGSENRHCTLDIVASGVFHTGE